MEKEPMPKKFNDFLVVGHVEKFGRVVANDILFLKDNTPYMVTIGTVEYVDDLKNANEKNIDKTLESFEAGEENVYVVDDPTDVERIRNKLLKAPLNEIETFLTPQEMDEESRNALFKVKKNIQKFQQSNDW